MAQTPSLEPNSQARDHFREGLASAQRGEVAAALRSFRSAYAAQPHYTVLYNIGQAEAALGHPVEAVEAFERYLHEGADLVSSERRQLVLKLLTANRERIGRLLLTLSAPERSRVWLNGAEVDRDRLQKPIPLKAGEHLLLHSSGEPYPQFQRVTVVANATTEVRLDAAPEADRRVALLAITCAVPGVRVTIAGEPQLTTPIVDPVLLPAGTWTVRFARPGYASTEQVVRLKPGRPTKVDCAQRPLLRLPPELRATLLARPTPTDAQVRVNGERLLNNALPAGPHDVLVERDGFIPTRITLELLAGATKTYSPVLQPTAAFLEAQAGERARRQTWGYIIGGASAALLATSGGLYTWNNGRYERFEQGRATATDDRNLDFATSIQRVDDLALGLLIAGVLGGAATAWTFF